MNMLQPTKSPFAQIRDARDTWVSTGNNIYRYSRHMQMFVRGQLQAVSPDRLADCHFLGGVNGHPISYKCSINSKWTTREYPATREGYRALMREIRTLRRGKS